MRRESAFGAKSHLLLGRRRVGCEPENRERDCPARPLLVFQVARGRLTSTGPTAGPVRQGSGPGCAHGGRTPGPRDRGGDEDRHADDRQRGADEERDRGRTTPRRARRRAAARASRSSPARSRRACMPPLSASGSGASAGHRARMHDASGGSAAPATRGDHRGARRTRPRAARRTRRTHKATGLDGAT